MSERRANLLRSLRPPLTSVRRFFDTGNILRFLVSMVLAFGLWAWVTYENDPETTRMLGGMPITIGNLDDQYQIVGEPPTVDVSIQGPQSIVAPLERESVTVLADMEDIEDAGEHSIDLEVTVPSGVRVRDVVPESITIDVDRIDTTEGVEVVAVEPDDVPPNLHVTGIVVEPETVSITGPARSLEQVDRAEVVVEIAGRTASFTESLELQLVDEDGQEVSGVQVNPAIVSVTVTLDVRGQVRKVIPVIVGDDALAPGHELVRTTVLPSDEVVIDGTGEDLSSVFFVTTVPVDISGWDDSRIVRDVEIDRDRLPDQVTVDQSTVHVSIEIRQHAHQREISDLPINVMNAPDDAEVTLDTNTATIVLEGAQAAVEAVEPDDITVFVNVANAGAGSYELELRVIVPAQVQYREVTPSFVGVRIESALEDDDGG